MDLLSVTDPGWVFPAVLAFMGTGFTILGTIWVRTTRASYREEDAALAKLRAITARQFAGAVSSQGEAATAPRADGSSQPMEVHPHPESSREG